MNKDDFCAGGFGDAKNHIGGKNYDMVSRFWEEGKCFKEYHKIIT